MRHRHQASLLLCLVVRVAAQSAFTEVDITSSMSFSVSTVKFQGACTVASKVVMIPRACDNLLIFDPSDNSQSLVTMSGAGLVAHCFWGCATVGTKVYMSPRNGQAGKVGIYDSSANSFSTVSITLPNTNGKYFQAASAVGTKVIFTPQQLNVVGIFDTTDNSFSTVATTGIPATNEKFGGAAVVGTKVIMAPYSHPNIGIFDTSTNTFSTVAIPSGYTVLRMFHSAVAVGTKVYMPGYRSTTDKVLIFDTADNSKTTVSFTSTAGYNFGAASALGTTAIFSPLAFGAIGVFDTTSNTLDTSISTTSVSYSGSLNYLYHSSAAVGNKVIMAPYAANKIGVYTCSTCSVSGATGDPHIVFANGGRADFRGSDKDHYVFLSSPGYQFAPYFSAVDYYYTNEQGVKQLVHGTFITRGAWVIKTSAGRELRISTDAMRGGELNVSVAGSPSALVGNQSLGRWRTLTVDNVRLTTRMLTVSVETDAWSVTATSKYIYGQLGAWWKDPILRRLDVSISGAFPQPEAHGIIGQSYQDSRVRNGKQDVYGDEMQRVMDIGRDFGYAPEMTTVAQAEGAIDGVARDYLLRGPFSTNSTFSRYHAFRRTPLSSDKREAAIEEKGQPN